jgi:glycosyltransferase involved in cell wall biosynthesis
MKSKTILFIGPMPPPVHGQAIGFQAAYEGYLGSKLLVNQNMTKKGVYYRIAITSWNIFKVFYMLQFKKIDAVYFTCNRSPLGGLFDVIIISLSRFYKTRIINHLFGGDFKTFYDASDNWLKRLLDFAYKKVSLSIVEHECLEHQFRDIFPDMPLKVVSNFYDRELETINTIGGRGEINLLYLSNIMKSKGILELLEAYGNLSEEYAHVSLTVAGEYLDDPYMSAAEIREAFLTRLQYLKEERKKKVQYVGTITGNQKRTVFQHSEIFILPTYYPSEGFPLSIIEAMRSGTVIIITDHNYLSKIFTEKNGRLIAKRSVNELEEAMRFFIDHPVIRRNIQEYNMRYAKKHYSKDRFQSSVNEALNMI